MNIFQLYLQLGVEHIADLHAYDHILFIVTLTAVYLVREWKKILILVTAFTIGHTATLALASMKIVQINTALIEFLIPVTILVTAIGNMLSVKQNVTNKQHGFKYFMALLFGLIHGLGFSNYLQSLLGNEESIIKPLFAFNLGIEVGQLIIVGIILVLNIFAHTILHVKHREWILVISGAGMGISFIMALERIPW